MNEQYGLELKGAGSSPYTKTAQRANEPGAATARPMLSVLAALADAVQIENEARDWTFGGNLVSRDHLGCAARPIYQNLLVARIDQPCQLCAVGNSVTHLILEILNGVGLGTQFDHEVGAGLWEATQSPFGRAAQPRFREVRRLRTQR